MKLVDILARELKEWPEGYTRIVQTQPDYTLPINDDCVYHNDSQWDYVNASNRIYDSKFTLSELASDKTTAIVTRAQWQAAVDALMAAKEKSIVIDWSRAPKEAMHCNREGTDFHDFSGGKHRYWLDWQWIAHPFKFEAYDTPGELIARPSTGWTGEGLPPVGQGVCEYRGAHQWDEWTVVNIFATWGSGSQAQVFVDYGDGWRAERDPERFRTVRTPEQIAAEEREHNIRNACTSISKDLAKLHVSEEITALAIIEAMIDAGYRKQVTP